MFQPQRMRIMIIQGPHQASKTDNNSLKRLNLLTFWNKVMTRTQKKIKIESQIKNN